MKLNKKLKAIGKLLNVMDTLRSDCPWDKKQTFKSLRPLTIEETYELADAILNKNNDEIKKELGDLLLHIIFYSKIASESNYFDIGDVANSITEKFTIDKFKSTVPNINSSLIDSLLANLKKDNNSVVLILFLLM